MALLQCEACGHEFDFPYDPAVLATVRRCDRCGRQALVIVDPSDPHAGEEQAHPDEDSG